MKLNCTFDLSPSEVNDALTAYVKDQLSYMNRPAGQALNFQVHNFGLRVEWGEPPEAQDDVPISIAPETSETTTKPEPVCQ